MATLTTTEILTDVLDAFKVQFPMLSSFTTEFTSQRLYKGQTVMAHLAQLPAAKTYDSTTGYANGATEANTLLEDLPITVDQHKHVPIKVSYLNAIADKKMAYQKAVDNRAYVLGKTIVDYALSLAVAENFTKEVVETAANSDKDTLGALRKQMTKQGAAPNGRFGLVNSDVAEGFDGDSRITSDDFYGQRSGSGGYLSWSGVGGFENIWEYPDLPGNSETMTGLFLDSRGIAIATALPDHNFDYASELNIPLTASHEVVQDEESGLALMGYNWMEPATGTMYSTVTCLFGAVAGAQGGTAGDLTDYAGVRLSSSSNEE